MEKDALTCASTKSKTFQSTKGDYPPIQYVGFLSGSFYLTLQFLQWQHLQVYAAERAAANMSGAASQAANVGC